MAEQVFGSEQFHEKLEAEMKDLAAEIRLHQERPETARLEGKELVRKSLEVYAAKNIGAGGEKEDASPLPEYAKDAPAGTRLEIERLVDDVFHKGILAASAEAFRSSPFVLDAFHDALAGRLYPLLQKRGIVK